MSFPIWNCFFRLEMRFLVGKCHFLSKNMISGQKILFPVGTFHFKSECDFRSENVISGLKMSFPVWKCDFRLENAISCRKVPFTVGNSHFQSEIVVFGLKCHIRYKNAISGLKLRFSIGKCHVRSKNFQSENEQIIWKRPLCTKREVKNHVLL